MNMHIFYEYIWKRVYYHYVNGVNFAPYASVAYACRVVAGYNSRASAVSVCTDGCLLHRPVASLWARRFVGRQALLPLVCIILELSSTTCSRCGVPVIRLPPLWKKKRKIVSVETIVSLGIQRRSRDKAKCLGIVCEYLWDLSVEVKVLFLKRILTGLLYVRAVNCGYNCDNISCKKVYFVLTLRVGWDVKPYLVNCFPHSDAGKLLANFSEFVLSGKWQLGILCLVVQ